MKKIRELNLNVGTSQPNYPGTSTKVYNGYSGGMINNADSSFSHRLQNVNKGYEDEESEDLEEEDMPKKETILRNRKKVNGKYNLQETFNMLEADTELNEVVSVTDAAADAYSVGKKSKDASALAKAAAEKTGIGKKILRSTIGGIPIIDVIYGTYRLASLAVSMKELGDRVSNLIDKQPGYFGQALIENDPKHWNNLIKRIVYHSAKDPEMQEAIKVTFNNLLETIKDFIITIIEAYDTPVEAAGGAAAGGPVGALAGFLGNAVTFVAGVGARTAPVERVLFAGVGHIAKGISAIIEFIFGKEGEKEGGKLQKQIVNLEEKGGSVLVGILRSPFDTLSRLHDLYNVLDKDAKKYIKQFGSSLKNKSSFSDEKRKEREQKRREAEQKRKEREELKRNAGKEKLADPVEIAPAPILAEIHKYPLLTLLEEFVEEESVDEESFEEIDLEEFSSAGAVAGYSLPLGASNKPASKKKDHHKLLEKQKEINEQIERMRILEAYHQKTSNKLK
jgi:hypothetical protein